MGIVASMISESFPPKSKFNVSDIPDLSGKVMIVTGGNTGVGKETVKALLQHNAKVYLAGRSQDRCQTAITDLKNETGKEAIFLRLDLGDLQSVKTAAAEFQSKEEQLHTLFNNAGVMVPPIDQLTAQSYDLQFGTNVLGHFYFTKLLLPTLLETAKAEPVFKARVVNTSSSASVMGSLNFATFKDSPARQKLGTQRLYAQSKFGNVVVAQELTRRYGDQGLVSTSLNPGNLNSDLQRHLSSVVANVLSLILYDVSYGALTQLWAGTSTEGANFGGQYLIPWARQGKVGAQAGSPEVGKELWKWLDEQVEQFEQSA
ncbi:NAD(P)-binding protein [Pluteus cervinus]|uniref:NAD(P)-binding protein n=1 Tax=Pluteus cervinus TaxID=181527 RepID=A0ACD3B9N2_9AGAR|nr:NAD(P)-binding protein [Pluteus cervinus]